MDAALLCPVIPRALQTTNEQLLSVSDPPVLALKQDGKTTGDGTGNKGVPSQSLLAQEELMFQRLRGETTGSVEPCEIAAVDFVGRVDQLFPVCEDAVEGLHVGMGMVGRRRNVQGKHRRAV